MQNRSYTAEDEIDLRQLSLGLWRRRWVILGVAAAAAALAAGVSLYVLPPVYESRTYIQLSEHSAQAYATPAAAARTLTSLSFLRPLAARHGIADGRRLERMVRAEPVRDTRMVYLRIRYGDPERLRAFTQDIVREFLQLASQRVRERREATRRRLAAVQAQIREVQRTLQLSRQVLDRIQTSRGGAESGFVRTFALNAAAVSGGVYSALVAAEKDLRAELVALELPSLVQEPYIPPEPVSPRPALNAAVAGTLGFLLTVFGVIVRDAWAAAPEAQGSAVGTLPEAR